MAVKKEEIIEKLGKYGRDKFYKRLKSRGLPIKDEYSEEEAKLILERKKREDKEDVKEEQKSETEKKEEEKKPDIKVKKAEGKKNDDWFTTLFEEL